MSTSGHLPHSPTLCRDVQTERLRSCRRYHSYKTPRRSSLNGPSPLSRRNECSGKCSGYLLRWGWLDGRPSHIIQDLQVGTNPGKRPLTGYEPEGREFESPRAHQNLKTPLNQALAVIDCLAFSVFFRPTGMLLDGSSKSNPTFSATSLRSFTSRRTLS